MLKVKDGGSTWAIIKSTLREIQIGAGKRFVLCFHIIRRHYVMQSYDSSLKIMKNYYNLLLKIYKSSLEKTFISHHFKLPEKCFYSCTCQILIFFLYSVRLIFYSCHYYFLLLFLYLLLYSKFSFLSIISFFIFYFFFVFHFVFFSFHFLFFISIFFITLCLFFLSYISTVDIYFYFYFSKAS